MSAESSSVITALLNQGVEEAQNGRKAAADETFREVLQMDPANETAILWQAYICDDVYKAVTLLEDWVRQYPQNQHATAYLQQATAKRDEIEQLLAGSVTYQQLTAREEWNENVTVPRLGEYLLKHGALTTEQLEETLRQYQLKLDQGYTPRIGQVMIELGYLNDMQLHHWLDQQNSEFNSSFQD